MNPEEYLDRLIERREHGEAHIPVAHDEIAAGLAAVEVLTQLREIDVPYEFASNLEFYIRTRARQNSMTIPMTRPQSLSGSRRYPVRRFWIAALGIAAVLMLA